MPIWQSVPIFGLKAWLDEQSQIGLRKNLLGKAVIYCNLPIEMLN
jgi:hypothetical protein